MKGESSGHTQSVKDIAFDCDGDTLLDPGRTNRRRLSRRLQILLLPAPSKPAELNFKTTEPQLETPEQIYGKK